MAAKNGAAEYSTRGQCSLPRQHCDSASTGPSHTGRLVALLDGRRGQALRSVMLGTDGGGMLPGSWDRAVRWYRRASRERLHREMAGSAVAAILGELRGVGSPEALRGRYRARDGDWALAVIAQPMLVDELQVNLRRIEDAAHGLRWLELVHGRRFDLGRSLVPQLPLHLLDKAIGAS